MQSLKSKRIHRLGRLWSFFVPVYFLAAAALDPGEVSNGEYFKFVQATRRPAPEYWINGNIPEGRGTEPVVLVNFDEAASYCRFVGRRLPSVEEWQSTCEARKLKKRGDIWEWTSTDVDQGGQTYKALCGPSNTCDCSHRYLPQWKNSVKGFRCVQDATPVTSVPDLLQSGNVL